MLHTEEYIQKSISEFKKRIQLEPQFCKGLFEHQTARLIAMKYYYYVLGRFIVKDDGYDVAEKEWYIMGRALGILEEDETSPCIGYDNKHPMNRRGLKIAGSLKFGSDDSYTRYTQTSKNRREFFRRYK